MLYITPGNMDTFPIEMSEKRLVSMVEAFDAYFGKGKANIEVRLMKRDNLYEFSQVIYLIYRDVVAKSF